jgi:hypothetical protein
MIVARIEDATINRPEDVMHAGKGRGQKPMKRRPKPPPMPY